MLAREMSTPVGLGPIFFCQKIEKTRPLKAANDGKVSFPERVGIFTILSLSQHVCEGWSRVMPERKEPPGSSRD